MDYTGREAHDLDDLMGRDGQDDEGPVGGGKGMFIQISGGPVGGERHDYPDQWGGQGGG